MDTAELNISQPDVSLDNQELDVSQHNASDVHADMLRVDGTFCST
jgi:hypothetical protein